MSAAIFKTSSVAFRLAHQLVEFMLQLQFVNYSVKVISNELRRSAIAESGTCHHFRKKLREKVRKFEVGTLFMSQNKTNNKSEKKQSENEATTVRQILTRNE